MDIFQSFLFFYRSANLNLLSSGLGGGETGDGDGGGDGEGEGGGELFPLLVQFLPPP